MVIQIVWSGKCNWSTCFANSLCVEKMRFIHEFKFLVDICSGF